LNSLNSESIDNVNSNKVLLSGTFTGEQFIQFPDLSGTIVLVDTVQTLSNKIFGSDLDMDTNNIVNVGDITCENLEVLGTSTIINTETVAINDNIILINSNQTGSPSSLLKG
jgi:hypothetical protein